MRKLFKGGNYSRAETIRGNTVPIIIVCPFYVEIEAIDVVIELFTYNFMECGTILLI